MRWAKQPQPTHGEKRCILTFLTIPTLLDGEWRWLERAWVCQTYRDGKVCTHGQSYWLNTHWREE